MKNKSDIKLAVKKSLSLSKINSVEQTMFLKISAVASICILAMAEDNLNIEIDKEEENTTIASCFFNDPDGQDRKEDGEF